MTELDRPGGAVLGLMPEDGFHRLLGDRAPHPADARGASRCELYLVVADPVAAYSRALAAGATELSPLAPRDWGHVVAYSRDPDGHVLAFAGPAPASTSRGVPRSVLRVDRRSGGG